MIWGELCRACKVAVDECRHQRGVSNRRGYNRLLHAVEGLDVGPEERCELDFSVLPVEPTQWRRGAACRGAGTCVFAESYSSAHGCLKHDFIEFW